METHVSSTTAEVRDTQEVVGADGNVELVIVVEKIEEDQQQKADSDSQDNAQPVTEGQNPASSQSTMRDGLQNSPLKQHQLQETMGKEVHQNQIAQTANKEQINKQSAKFENKTPQNKLPDKQVEMQNTPTNKLPAQVENESTSSNDIHMNEGDEVDNKNNITLNITLERRISTEPQTEMSGDASEKEHNKSISRELKSLINSAKESKIISECTKLTSKTRKSRTALDASNTNITSTPEGDGEQSNRRSSSASQKSNSSEKSDNVGKRSMRSQNPEFVHKVKQFLNSVTGKFQRGGDSDGSSASDEEVAVTKNKQNNTGAGPSTANNRRNSEQAQPKADEKGNKLRSDPYCWRCHWPIDEVTDEENPPPPLMCTVCPRAFHFRCLTGNERARIVSEKTWVCPECMIVLHAESSESRSTAMKKTSLGMLCELLKYALLRMKESSGAEPFLEPVDRAEFPAYDKFVVHPMDLTLMNKNIAEGLYGSTEAFLADTYWILHNSIIFNSLQSKMTTAARALVRACRTEMGEIEACPECYAAAHARRPTWFTDVCTTPHMVLWAKLKGFPYWPAKAMSVTHAEMVDVRFFGAHDRAWVPARDCYLYCEKDPNNFRTKRQDILDSMQEAEQHIGNISRKYGKFLYAPYRTVFEPSKMEEQLKLMIPSYDGPVRSPIRRSKTPALGKKSRSNSKSSKDDSNIGDILSDSEPMDAETSKTSEEIEGATPVGKTQNVLSRKRRRSETKESAGSVVDSSPKVKRRLVDYDGKESAPKKSHAPSVSSSNETAQKPNEADETVSDEPIEIDCEPASSQPPRPTPNKSDIPATRATPNKPDAAAKPNKNISKSNIAPPPSNKTPAKIDTVKVNDKGKSTPQEDKTFPQNLRNSRSNKSLTNIETIELDDVNANSPSTSKMSTQSASNTSKINPNGTKNNSKESVSATKTVEEEKIPESAVLIKITDKEKDSTTSFTINVNDKLAESATLTKIANILNPSANKNKEKDKETENNIPNKDNVKEKVTTTATPTKPAGKPDTAPATPSSQHLGNQKPNENSVATNKTVAKDKPVEVSTSSNKPGQETEKAITSTDKTPLADNTTENNTEGKKDTADKDKGTPGGVGKSTPTPKPGSSKAVKPSKDRLKFDDDTSISAVSRKVPKTSVNSDTSSVATSSGVRSDSPAASPAPPAAAPTTRSSNTAKTKTTQVTVEVNPDSSSIFTPTSTDNVRNMKEAVNKLQKLRSAIDPPPNPQVGLVAVRSFARMTSPSGETQAKPSDVFVEIKSEPMDFEDGEVQDEAPVLTSLRPRPVATAVSGGNLREVRIAKVIPATVITKKGVKAPDVRPRAKKTFPQPKKADDGRSELTNKNSMVYIPTQPPASQAPVRAAPKGTVPTIVSSSSMPVRTPALLTTTNVKALTPIAPPLLPMAPPPPPPPPLPPLVTTNATVTVVSGAAAATAGAGAALAGAIIAGPGFPTVPTTVHTVPLITSVNGQWTFSLQPVMSVGGNSMTSPTVNGLGDRAAPTVTPAPTAAAAVAVSPGLVSQALVTPALVAPAGPFAPPALLPTAAPVAPSPAAPETTLDPPLAEPPQLQQRPVLQHPLAAGTEVGEMPAPSAAGPLTAKLNQNSIKLAEFFRTLLEDSLVQVEEPAAEAAALRLQLEQARWQHQHELSELQHTHDLLLMEVRSTMEKEKTRAVAEARRLQHQELEAAVKEAKSKQWCCNCGQEAQFYCCWNTSYCDYPCQRAHWVKHFSSCTQQRTTGAGSGERRAADQGPPAPPAEVPKTTAAPSLTIAGKVASAASRLVSSDQNKSPASVGVIEDGSGHISTKSATASPAQATPVFAPPLPPNKKLLSKEESGTKRVVTSGGYLIVGAGAGPGAGAGGAAPGDHRRAPARRD